MTALLERAFEQATKLPDAEQNALAKWLIEELAAEREWAKAFSESEDVLEKLADEAIESKKQGRTTSLDLDRL
jgi:hypothetical protein